jgi:integrase
MPSAHICATASCASARHSGRIFDATPSRSRLLGSRQRSWGQPNRVSPPQWRSTLAMGSSVRGGSDGRTKADQAEKQNWSPRGGPGLQSSQGSQPQPVGSVGRCRSSTTLAPSGRRAYLNPRLVLLQTGERESDKSITEPMGPSPPLRRRTAPTNEGEQARSRPQTMTLYEHGSQMSLAMRPDDAGAQKSTHAQIAGFRAMPQPRPPRRRRGGAEAQALTRAELARLLAGLPERWRPFHELLAETGIRVAEALGLDWPDVQFGVRPRLRVRRQFYRGTLKRLKSRGGHRDMPLSRSLARKLWTARPADGAGRVRDPQRLAALGPQPAPRARPGDRARRVGQLRRRRPGAPGGELPHLPPHPARRSCSTRAATSGRCATGSGTPARRSGCGPTCT